MEMKKIKIEIKKSTIKIGFGILVLGIFTLLGLASENELIVELIGVLLIAIIFSLGVVSLIYGIIEKSEGD